MTVDILDALVRLAPATIALHATTRSRCIMATRVGCEVLSYFGIEHTPLAVNVLVMNAACEEWIKAGQPGDVEEVKARGVHMIQVDETVEGPGWAGHCVIEVEGGILDLDLQQFQRPEKAIVLPHAASFATADDRPWVYSINGSWLRYEPRRGDLSFMRAPDWKAHKAGEHPVAGMLIRAINAANKGTLDADDVVIPPVDGSRFDSVFIYEDDGETPC